ncbi:RlpA-like double-psi beta-barrel-protein domain-containing protein-containing protein [Schizophyllum amplum]|uniref:RlpA-like double-psi beta-barrel-protein domain-containing protein-containing protein n=1 Tax=Schizophyllum amplum TaxID=97359 RepID=A0A550CD85_9AGAR|nr:RlpA-like double-psi beta-barrel-protein domain-containing protein-containing protein [Auriculariopsis ampla]
MFASTFVAALATLSAVQALPMNSVWSHARRDKPDSYAEGYLENYDTYHTRYLAIGCQNQHNTQFFDDCCHPMLATETLAANRASYCDPANISSSVAASSTAVETHASTSSSAAPAATSGNVNLDGEDDDEYDDCDEDEGDDDEESSSEAAPASTSSSVEAEPTSTYVEPTSTYVEPTSTYVEPTTSYEAPATTSSSEAPATTSTSSGGSGDLTGTATYFYQNGVAGSCGTVHADSDYVAAMTPDEYSRSGDICGKSVHITNTKTGQSVDVTVADTCPTCTTGQDIDLSVAAFQAIGVLDDGVESISWSYN